MEWCGWNTEYPQRFMCLCTRNPPLAMLYLMVTEPLGGGAILEKVGSRGKVEVLDPRPAPCPLSASYPVKM